MKNATVFILLLTLLISCKKSQQADTLTSGLIYIAVSDEFQNLMEAEIDAFCGHFDTAYIIPAYCTEKDAIRLLVEDSVRFAVATRDITDWERHELDKKNLAVRRSTIAFDAVTLITNPANSDSLMSLTTIKKILTGEITEWKQINPKNHSGTIRVLFDSQQSGVFRYIVDSLLKRDMKKTSPNLYELGTAAKVMEKTAEYPNTLGFIAFNQISNEHSTDYADVMQKIRLVHVSREDTATVENSYLPYAGEIWKERYPLWRSVNILISDPRSGLPTGFGVFIANQVGQKVVQKAGLMPITDAQNINVEIIDDFPTESK
ncbi:MAG: substrate-binding domain-containing protein [Dysgonamonadaceae bacterium]|jgi:phosphate transport system substrate-binding protein|nr:substrate-binding domain-containing protein [Dysgonamonadaceae bacterium]